MNSIISFGTPLKNYIFTRIHILHHLLKVISTVCFHNGENPLFMEFQLGFLPSSLVCGLKPSILAPCSYSCHTPLLWFASPFSYTSTSFSFYYFLLLLLALVSIHDLIKGISIAYFYDRENPLFMGFQL